MTTHLFNLFNLSKRSDELQAIRHPAKIVEPRKKAPRLNQTKCPTGEGDGWSPRIPKPNEAASRNYTTYHLPIYATGDGDVVSVRRPGSDHSHIKSKGISC